MNRRNIIIIALVLIVGTGSLYFLLRRSGSMTTSPTSSNPPFGTPPSDTAGSGGTGNGGRGSSTGDTGSAQLARFFKLSDVPVAGFKSFLRNGSTFVRYVDRSTGHVYDVNPTTLEKIQIFNTTDPKVYEAIFKDDASGFVARRVPSDGDTVSNTSVSLLPPKATSTSPLYTAQATLLRGLIGDIAVAPDTSLIYVLNDTGAVISSSFQGEKPKTLVSLDFNEWRILPENGGNAILATKASSNAEGYAYSTNLKTGGLTKVLGPLLGLTVLPSPDGRRLAYSYISSGVPLLAAENLGLKATSNLSPATLPEKCAWSEKTLSTLICGAPANGLGSEAPELWYQGVAHYEDQIWRFNTDTGTAEILLAPKKSLDIGVDVYKPELSPDEDYLFFINKDDLSLWALKLLK